MRYKIGVSGSAANNCEPGAYAKSREVGRQIALHGAVTVTGDTVGVPHAAAHGAKAAGGITVGVSPAASLQEHIKKYHLPNDQLDLIIYTGFHYSGRNLLFIRSCDAVIFICGRVGTLNEFTIAFEDGKPIGVLLGTGGITTEIEQILKVAHRGQKNVIFDTSPDGLVKKVLARVEDVDRVRSIPNVRTTRIVRGKRR